MVQNDISSFSCIGNCVPHTIKSSARMRTMCRRKLLRSRTLARKVYKSLMSEKFRELKWTCPLCSSISKENALLFITFVYEMSIRLGAL